MLDLSDLELYRLDPQPPTDHGHVAWALIESTSDIAIDAPAEVFERYRLNVLALILHRCPVCGRDVHPDDAPGVRHRFEVLHEKGCRAVIPDEDQLYYLAPERFTDSEAEREIP